MKQTQEESYATKILIAIRLDQNLYNIMKSELRKRKMSKSDFIREAIANNCGYKFIPSTLVKIK